jgi:hypothetical protein
VLLRVMGTIWGLMIIPSIPAAMMSPMMIAAPGSEDSPLTLLFMYTTLFSPLIMLATSIACFVLSRSKRLGEMIGKAILLAFAPVLIHGGAFILIIGVCRGKFVC